MNDDYFIACICEGAFEQAIMEVLLDHNRLIFSSEQLLEKEIIRCRKAKNFESRYLDKALDKKIKIYRILDSRNEAFKLSKAYASKIEVINIVTAPEIEILLIHAEDQYEQYVRSGQKPSDFANALFKKENVKSYEFVKRYFNQVSILITAIEQYCSKRNSKYNELTLLDLIK